MTCFPPLCQSIKRGIAWHLAEEQTKRGRDELLRANASRSACRWRVMALVLAVALTLDQILTGDLKWSCRRMMGVSWDHECFMGWWEEITKFSLELFWFGYDSVQLQYATILLEFLTVARKQLVSWSSEWRYNVYNPQPAENIESFTWNNFIWLFDPGHPCLDSVHCVQLSSQNISGILPWVGPSSFWVIWCWDILRWWWWQVIDGCDVSLACFVTRRAGVSNVQKLSLDVIDQARRHNTTNDGCLSAWEVWSKSE